MSNISIIFICDSCGREVFSCNIVNGMKFCTKCYQETFGNQQNKERYELLVNSLAEKDKQIAELQKQLEEKEEEIETKNIINNLYKTTMSLRDGDFKDLVYENNSLKQQLKSQPAEIVEKIKEMLKGKELIADGLSCQYICYCKEDIDEIINTILKEHQK